FLRSDDCVWLARAYLAHLTASRRQGGKVGRGADAASYRRAWRAGGGDKRWRLGSRSLAWPVGIRTPRRQTSCGTTLSPSIVLFVCSPRFACVPPITFRACRRLWTLRTRVRPR